MTSLANQFCADGHSYTTFEMSDLHIKEVHRKAKDTIQPTREQFVGNAGLYDTLVSPSI